MKFSMKDFFSYLSGLSQKGCEMELAKLGWENNRLKSKEFSKAYIDLSGQLKNFMQLPIKLNA